MRIDRTKHNKFVTGAVYGNTTSGGITPSSSTASAVGGGGSTVIIQGGGGSQEPVKLGLGDLTNVGTWANEVATEDRFIVLVADGNQWVAKPISDIIYDESDLATYAKISYVNEKLADKVDNAFFLRIFGVIGENDEEIPVNDVSSTIKSILAKFGLWTYDFLSAIGLNPTDGEITAISLASLNDVLLNLQLIEGQALVWNGDFWTNQSIKSGLDENSLLKYLYANKYVTQDYVTEQLLSYATIGELNLFKVETSKNLDNLQSEINDLDDKKLDKSFFKALFGLMDNDVEIEPNVKEIPESASIKAKFGLWTEEYLSALGMNPADGEVALTLSSLNDVLFTNLKEGQSVVWDGGKWVNLLIESGLNESALDIYLNENEYAKKSDIPVIPTTDINKGVTAYGWGDHSKVGYLTGITSKLVTDALGYTPYDVANFTKANIKSTLGISDWALASSKPSYTTKDVAEDTNLYFTNARAVAALKSITDGLQSDIDTKLDASVFSELFEKVTLEGGVTAIRAKYGLFTDYFLSAKGANSSGGSSSGGGLITSLYRYADLGKTFSDTNNDTFNAYTINKINADLGSRISVLEGKATNVSFTQSLTSGTQIGVISIDGASKNIYAPTIPTDDINKGVTAYGWGNHATKGYITASASITGNAASASLIKPTTGTGVSSSWVSLTSYTKVWGEAFNVSSLGSDTGDIALYLRSGVYTKNSAELCVAIDGDFYAQIGSKKVLHEGNYTDYAYSKTTIDSKFSGLGTFAYKSSLAFADLTNKPTTISGYGITDALTALTSRADTNLSITVGGTTKSIANLYARYTERFRVVWNNPSEGTYDLNDLLGGYVRAYGSGGTLVNAPESFGHGAVLSLTNGTKALSGQLAWNIKHGNTTDVTKNLYWRVSDSANGYTYAKWHQIAFTDYTYSQSEIDTKLGGYLPLSGGTLTGRLLVTYSPTSPSEGMIAIESSSTSKYPTIRFDGNISWGYLGFSAANTPTYFDNSFKPHTIIHSGNIGSQSVASATRARYIETKKEASSDSWYGDEYMMYAQWITGDVLKLKVDGYYTLTDRAERLQTARKIWGQSFNGTADVSGALSGVSQIFFNSQNTHGIIRGNLYSSSLTEKDLVFNSPIACFDGNVGIGTKSPQYNLHVKSVAPALMCESTASESSIYFSASSENAYRWAIGKGVWSIGGDFGIGEYNTAQKLFFRIAKNGNVGIGLSYATAPSYKLHINGTLHASDAVSFGSTLDVTSKITLSGTTASTANIAFSRSSYNYITFPTDGSLCLSTAISTSGIVLRVTSTAIEPMTTATKSVGTSSKRWGAIYGVDGDFSGTLHATTGIWSDGYVSAKGQNTSSDMRLKNVLNEVVLGVKDIANAPSIRFSWKNGGGVDVGSSAQYWQGLLPDAVKEQNSLLEMQYGNIALLSAIALAKNFETHEERIARLEKENRELRNEINSLKYGKL